MTKIRNFTPHPLNIFDETGTTKLLTIPSEGVARVTQTNKNLDPIQVGDVTIPIAETRFGAVEGLPEPEPGVILVVSRIVRSALPSRDDLIVPDSGPNGAVRDENGRIIGVKGFLAN